jgi:hypothetical protein
MLKQIFYKFKFDKIDRTVMNTTIVNDRLNYNEEFFGVSMVGSLE